MSVLQNDKVYHVQAAGDGTRDSKLCFGQNVKRELMSMMWFGTYEDAIQDEMNKTILDEIDNPDYWDQGEIYHCKLEQAYIDISLVNDYSALIE